MIANWDGGFDQLIGKYWISSLESKTVVDISPLATSCARNGNPNMDVHVHGMRQPHQAVDPSSGGLVSEILLLSDTNTNSFFRNLQGER